MLKRLFITSPFIWRRFALVAIVFGLLGSVFLMPLPVNAAEVDHCDDGGPRSTGEGGGYEPGSECAFFINNYSSCVWLSDEPNGPKDEIRCSFDIPEAYQCGTETIKRDELDKVLRSLQNEGFYTNDEVDEIRTSPCRLFRLSVELIPGGQATGYTKGDIQCPSNGSVAPSARWSLRDVFGKEWAFFQLSQYACWDGQSVTDQNGKLELPDPIITADTTGIGQLMGMRYEEEGEFQAQHEAWNGNPNGIYRVIQTGIVFEYVGPLSIDIPFLPAWVVKPTVSLAIRADGFVERNCQDGGRDGCGD